MFLKILSFFNIIKLICIYKKPFYIYNKLSTITKKWNRLVTFVSVTENKWYRIYFISLKMLVTYLYEILLLSLNYSVTKINNKLYQINYKINNKNYKMLLKVSRTPIIVVSVKNANGDDITEHVLPYLGPNFDWHGYKIKPDFFKTTMLTLYMSDGTKQNII